ncbi:MAG: LamG-like jellyroll fold domain-containing protein, partial [Candidatus Roizmanbacteria bacterium]
EVRKSDYQITGSMSVGAWWKSTTAGPANILSKIGPSLGVNTYRLVSYSGNSIAFGVNGGIKYSTVSVSDNNWHFLTATYDGSGSFAGITIYIDGTSVATTTVGSFPGLVDNFEPLTIGGELYGSNFQYSRGSIDEPFVTDVVLTPGQIFDMYNSGR